MVLKTFSLLFRLKKPAHYKKGNVPVYMRITIDSERTELSVNREFDPSRWNKKAGRANGTKEDAKTLNEYLDTLMVKVHKTHQEIMVANEPLTSENLKQKLSGKDKGKGRPLLQIFAAHNHDMKALIIRGEYAKGTHTHFETSLRHVTNFIYSKLGCRDVDVAQVDYDFISRFEYYLKVKICAHNTAMKYLGDLKKIILLCVKRGWLAKDPFLAYKMRRREVLPEFLVDEELQTISNKEFSTERLTLVKNIFLFSCYTGLAYADAKKLKRSEIRVGIDGKQWIFIKRQKSTTPSPIPLLPVALSILEKYRHHPRCVKDDLVLPILCNQKMNEYLKEIADLCSIQKKLTYHTARHTFGTSVTLNNDVPIESVSKMLGHKSLKQTQHYARILNKKVGQDMQALHEKFAVSTSIQNR